MSAEQVLRAYRFDKATILELTRMVQDDLEPKINIHTSTPPLIKVISVLHFCASGSFQNTVGLATGMSQPCFSGILHQVLPAFLRHVKNHISFPVANAEVAAVKGGFYRVARIPHVVGAIDGSHVPLTPPAQRAHVYINRKKFHSINVQAVCNSDMVFTHCCARFPGSAHDATVMQNSSIPRLMAGLQQQTAWLLGDAGYPCEQWLLTPLRNPRTPAEVAYNRAHVKTRNVIERSFGLLKSRFRCLHRTGGALLYAPEKVCHIVLLCFMLHNIAIQRRVPLPPDNEPDSDESDADSSGSEQDQQACPPINPRIPLAQQARARVIQDYFT